jgi:hypothetical protein
MQKPICNSDHVGIKLVIRTGKLPKQPIRQQRSRRQKLAQHDRAELETTEGRKAFNDKCNASICIAGDHRERWYLYRGDTHRLCKSSGSPTAQD